MISQINWNSFSYNNHDANGIRLKFEDLCRQLFINENLSGNKQFKYLHANPNNAGLETDPILDEDNNRRIGFQAKYFDNEVDYNKIETSVLKTVEHYKGQLDLVFLFSNKPLSMKSLKKSNDILLKAGITLQLITDNMILDLIRKKYPYLGYYYFGEHSLNSSWFNNHNYYMYEELGDRYNQEFNVETISSRELSLFVHDQNAVKYINDKKIALLTKIHELKIYRTKYHDYLKKMESAVHGLTDVDLDSLYSAIEWKHTLETTVQTYLSEYKTQLNELHSIQKQLSDYNAAQQKKDVHKTLYKRRKIRKEIENLYEIISLSEIVSITEREQQLLYGKVLAVCGQAGTGKSQLLASQVKILTDNNRAALLLVAGLFFTDAPILDQIMSNLQLDFKFDVLLNILESIGERNNCIVPIFIDALNETWHNRLWKANLTTIIDQVNLLPMVKLVFSFRPEYTDLLLSQTVQKKIKDNHIIIMNNDGFKNNSIHAVKSFLNHYNIPFTPLAYFGAELSNPLFLTLYCKTYNGESICLSDLYERLIKNANDKIFASLEQDLRNKGYSSDINLVEPFIDEIAMVLVTKHKRVITKEELYNLCFWKTYNLTAAPFIYQIVKEHILYDSRNTNTEYYHFAYDQMNDYYCAKAIVRQCDRKDLIRDYIKRNVLEIYDGKLHAYNNIDLFVNICAKYAEKYGEECIDVIDELKSEYEGFDARLVFSRYLISFQWRNNKQISVSQFEKNLELYPYDCRILWDLLIGNSLKTTNPLNADYLHKLLSSYELNQRDYLWTIYINSIPTDEDNRLVQLVEMYNKGEVLEASSDKQIELLLTLFGWILTSSNRWLRDYTSKAMIEILKDHFDIAIRILKKFKSVNDPYVIQRLYGVVFGACCKRTTPSIDCFRELSEYIYNNVFCQEKVYPDILLRDYARLIIEYFLYEEPNYTGCIIYERIVPPYNSDPIPDIEDQHYLDNHYSGSLYSIIDSMRFEGMGWYGDFGRYVFQSALRYFNVDDKIVFNYAIYYIIHELGFSEEYFDEYDTNRNYYDRNITVKTERIGKKYQWIAMYSLLARISDHYTLKDCYYDHMKNNAQFEGPWEPYVRDFDPTLNNCFMTYKKAPLFTQIDDFIHAAIAEINKIDITQKAYAATWLNSFGVFQKINSILLQKDNNGVEWVTLSAAFNTGYSNLNTKGLYLWCRIIGYFTTAKQKSALKKCSNEDLYELFSFPETNHETYTIFNREYPWAPSCKEFNNTSWIDIEIKTGEKKTVTETVEFPDYLIEAYIDRIADENASNANDIAKDLEELYSDIDTPYDITKSLELSKKEIQRTVDVTENIGSILKATSTLMWEEEYDATKKDAIIRSVPCAELIQMFRLKQLQSDGFFFDTEGKLAAFDVDLSQKHNCFVIRKDLLDLFLKENQLKLVWYVDGQKEIHGKDRRIDYWSEWNAILSYEKDKILGKPKRIK